MQKEQKERKINLEFYSEKFERLKFSVINAFPLNEVSNKNKSRVFLALATKSNFPRIDFIE